MDLPHHALQQTTTPTTTAAAADSSHHIITAAAASSKDPCTTTTTTNSNNIVKGKRTKRQRPPTINNVTRHSSTSYNNAFNSSSPASSSEFPASSTTTQDEDTANCLILLSKGTHHQVLISPTNYNNVSEEFPGYKFNSKRYIQTSSTEGLTATGIYVYECKTCSRTFPSFQALGGHRASHKKPRITNEFDTRKPYNTAFSDEDEFPSRKNNISPSHSSSLSLQLNHRSVSYNPAAGNTKKSSSTSKLHECSICGAEFNSGQALGGHMRRHRAANGNINTTTVSAAVTVTNTTLSLIPYAPTMADDEDDINIQKSRNDNNDGLYLDLDLNLPAPSETAVGQDQQHRESSSSLKFTANQNKQQPVVHLSATPTLLVDCHY